MPRRSRSASGGCERFRQADSHFYPLPIWPCSRSPSSRVIFSFREDGKGGGVGRGGYNKLLPSLLWRRRTRMPRIDLEVTQDHVERDASLCFANTYLVQGKPSSERDIIHHLRWVNISPIGPWKQAGLKIFFLTCHLSATCKLAPRTKNRKGEVFSWPVTGPSQV